MITVKEYRGHIRNWEALCEELGISKELSREEREEKILLAAYEKFGGEMALHMHGMFAFALYDDKNDELFCLRDQFEQSRSITMSQMTADFFTER